MRTRALLIVVLTLLVVTLPVARAELTAFWRHNPITAPAIAADPQLAGMQSWSLMATNTNGLFAAVGLRATLPAGLHFYHVSPPLGGDTLPRPQDVSANPALAFDTYVTSPVDRGGGVRAPGLVGPFPKNQPPLSMGGPGDPVPGRLSVAWGDPFEPDHLPGTFELARLTFPVEALPTVHPASAAFYHGPDQVAPVPTAVPEPALLSGVAALVLAARRQRIG